MKRTLVAITLLLLAAGALAQEAKKSEPPQTDIATARQFKVRIFEIQNRNPQEIERAIRLLGSGFGASGLMVNEQLRTITVRDFPENIAAMEDAIKRLDRPAAAVPNVDLRISILIGSRTAIAGASPLPEDLTPVVKELRSALAYSHYVLVASNIVHPRPGPGADIRSEGVADPSSLGLGARPGWPVSYTSVIRDMGLTTIGDRSALTGEFEFYMRFPFGPSEKTAWQSARVNTPVTLRDGQQLVVGTTSVGDNAVIVVMSAKFTAEK